MIIIKKSKKGCHVVRTGKNGKILYSSENLKTQFSAWVNIFADARANTTSGFVWVKNQFFKNKKHQMFVVPEKKRERDFIKSIIKNEI